MSKKANPAVIGGFVVSGVIGVAALASRGEFRAALAAIGAASFGLPRRAAPIGRKPTAREA